MGLPDHQAVPLVAPVDLPDHPVAQEEDSQMDLTTHHTEIKDRTEDHPVGLQDRPPDHQEDRPWKLWDHPLY